MNRLQSRSSNSTSSCALVCTSPSASHLATVLENLPLVYDCKSQTLQRRTSINADESRVEVKSVGESPAGGRVESGDYHVEKHKMQADAHFPVEKPTFKRGHIRRSSYESAQIRLPVPASPAAVARANSLNRAAMLDAASCSTLSAFGGLHGHESECSASAASIETGQTADSAIGESVSSKRSSLDRKSQSSFIDWSSDGVDGGAGTSPRGIDDDGFDGDEHAHSPGGEIAGKKTTRRLVLPSISLPRGLFSRHKQTATITVQPIVAPWRLFSDRRATSLKNAGVVSSTGLILEQRPRLAWQRSHACLLSSLPAKSEEEEAKHRAQHLELIEAAKKKEAREAKDRKRAIEMQRRLEDQAAAACRQWREHILPKWDEMKASKRCRELWWQGIPSKVRGHVWSLVVGNDLNLTEDLYEICCARARERLAAAADCAGLHGTMTLSSGDASPSASERGSRGRSPTPQHNDGSCVDRESTVELIQLDVSRTFPQLGIFQSGGPYSDLLFRLLGSYVCYRPDVGYVQSMSFVAAVLLLQMEPYDAFVAFANLLNRPLQLAFFRLRQPQMTEYFIAYDQYFEQELPRLHAHFDQLDVRPDLYLIEWLYTLYAKSLPLDVTCRVWDMFLRDGEEFLFKTALGILRTFERQLLEMEFDEVVQFLSHLPEDLSGAELFRNIEPFMRPYASTAETAKCKRRFLQILADVNERINPSSQCLGSSTASRRPSGGSAALDAAAGSGALTQLSSQVAGMKMSKSLSGFLGDLLRPPPPTVTVLNHTVSLPVETVAATNEIVVGENGKGARMSDGDN